MITTNTANMFHDYYASALIRSYDSKQIGVLWQEEQDAAKKLLLYDYESNKMQMIVNDRIKEEWDSAPDDKINWLERFRSEFKLAINKEPNKFMTIADAKYFEDHGRQSKTI